MPFTEIFLVRLSPGLTMTDPDLRQNLSSAQRLNCKFARSDLLLTQIEDPTLFYLVRDWESLALADAWEQSQEHDTANSHIKDHMSIEWKAFLPISFELIDLGAPTLCIGRYSVSSSDKTAFTEVLEKNKHHVEEGTKPYTLAGGWRMEKTPDDEEEWVQFTGWKDVAQHVAFESSAANEEGYGKLRPFVKGADVKHAQKLQLEP